MAFYVQKSFAHGPIRFGVTPRRPLDKIHRRSADTGAKGDPPKTTRDSSSPARLIGSVQVPVEKGIVDAVLVVAETGRDAATLGFLALMIGCDPSPSRLRGRREKVPGWVEVILGAAMVATSIVLTAQAAKKIREQEEKERAERENEQRRHREMLAAYVAGLQNRRERERRDIERNP